jgi:cytochrome c-type biogenesis protein CcmH
MNVMTYFGRGLFAESRWRGLFARHLNSPSPPSSLGGEGRGEGAARESVNASAPLRLFPRGDHDADANGRAAPSPNPLPQRKSRWGRGLSRVAAVALFALLALSTLAHAIDPLQFKDREQEVRFQNLAKQLRCLVCQNQDLADSDADLAKDLRKQVFDMMQSGKSDAQIKEYLVARYNDFVLYDPPLKPGTMLLWFAPGVLVLIGAVVLIGILRRRQKQWTQASASDSAAVTPQTAGSSGTIDHDPGEDW